MTTSAKTPPSTARPRPHLWMVFAAVGVLALGLGLAGLAWVRVYDEQLLHQTESELIAQGVLVAEVMRLELEERGAGQAYGVARELPWPFPVPPGGRLEPVLPTLRARGPLLPPPEDPPSSSVPADPLAAAAGEALKPILERAHRSTLAALRVTDAHGVVVATSGVHLGASLLAHQELVRALRGQPNSVLRRRLSDPTDAPLESLSRETGFRASVAIPILAGDRVWGAVLATRTPRTLAKTFYADRWSLGATGLVLVAVVALLSAAAATLVLRPLRAVVYQARAIAVGDAERGAPIARPRVAELAELSEALAVMANEVRERTEYIRSFAANVSHEFKTPLASIQGAVELLRESFEHMSSEERGRFLANIEDDARRLTLLVQRLLELARADSMGKALERADAPVQPLLESLASRARHAGRAVTVASQAPELRVCVPAELLGDVLWQLMSNAWQHGGESVSVTLRCLPEEPEGPVHILVQDDGRGISEANRSRIFDAFFTTARDRGGTGLGLTIARSLLRPFGARLELLPSEGEGTIFAVVAARSGPALS